MRGTFKALFAGLVLLAVFAAGFAVWLVKRQGVTDAYWSKFSLAKVAFDEQHIPTIEATDWERLVMAQGFVVASDRLWHMDLLRRKAGGRLSEWFGESAYELDKAVQLEDRIGVARASHLALPIEEKAYCEAYANGVNRFIDEFENRWGIEYVLLRQAPEPWTCVDTLLVVLEMAHVLSSQAEREAQQFVWKERLPPAWREFLFPLDHPWNEPLFGVGKPLQLPPENDFLPKRSIGSGEAVQEASARYIDPVAVGSNSWAWRGKSGYFLANDPHLGYGVPQIWYPMRLRISKDDWAVGMTIPGLPGFVLGMNPALAWTFTNTGEDVDDYLEETLSEDGQNYLLSIEDGKEVWQPVIKKEFEIKVKGELEARRIVGSFTRRGPIAPRPHLGGKVYARQWLPLKDGRLRCPSVQIIRSRTISELQKAMDAMAAPAQNVIYMDYRGTMGYRVVGTGVVRRMSGLVPHSALEGEWLGFEPPEQRRRLEVSHEVEPPQHLATANQRIWADEFGHHWSADDRNDRIKAILGMRGDYTRRDMEALHMDTTSRFRQMLLQWITRNAGEQVGGAAPLVKQWEGWDGSSRSNVKAFTQAALAEDYLVKLLIGRVQEAFMPKNPSDDHTPYTSGLRRAWLIALLESQPGHSLEVFGLDNQEVAIYLLERLMVAEQEMELHPWANRWRGQHPFVGRIPLLGSLFAIDEYEQWGAHDLVLAEQPRFGPSVRVVWDMSRPWESSWIFPVGQSGHLGSKHYDDWQEFWQGGNRLAVFDDPTQWNFIGREVPATKH